MEDVNVTVSTDESAEKSAENEQQLVNSDLSTATVEQTQETTVSENTAENAQEENVLSEQSATPSIQDDTTSATDTASNSNSSKLDDETLSNNASALEEKVDKTEQSENPSSQSSNTSKAHNTAHPSPSSFASRANTHNVSTSSLYSASDIQLAQSFGRADEHGTVYVKQADSEREVGQFPDATAEEALTFYARRYLDLKARLDLFENRLQQPTIRPREIDQSLKTLGKEVEQPDVVGDLEALNIQFARIQELAESKKEQLLALRKEHIAQAVQERTTIVEAAEKLASNITDHTNWRTTSNEFNKLFDKWQEQQKSSIRIDKNLAESLWTRFSSARTTFNQARRKWINERDNLRNETRAAKEAIIKEAEELQHSHDWVATSKKFNELMNRWRTLQHLNRKEDDALWQKFRAANAFFYNARQEDRTKTNEDEQHNLKKKEELVEKAEQLLPVSTVDEAKRARKKLSEIQQEWDSIGFVPRQDRRRIESRLDAVEKQIKSVEDSVWKQSDPEANARKNSFTAQLELQLAQLDKQIAQCTDEKKKAQLEAEKATKQQWLNAIQ